MTDDGSQAAGTGLSDVRNLLGFLVAGFAGVLNVIGLKSAEIGVVLRNEPIWVPVVAVLLLGGILAAVLSVFTTAGGQHPVPPIAAVITILAAAASFPAIVWLIPSPFPGHSGEHLASVAVTIALLGVSVLLCAAAALFRSPARAQGSHWIGRRVQRNLQDLLNLQCLLLAVAVMLTSASAYGALRLETISQTSTLAEIGDRLQLNGQAGTLTISVSASKLSTQDWVSVDVAGAPSTWDIVSMCHVPSVVALREKINQDISVVSCEQDPCFYFARELNRQCVPLSADVIAPDSSGGVQRTLEVPFLASAYQHLQVTAVTCQPLHDHQPSGTCGATGATSRLDIALPLPASGGAAH